MTQNLIDEFIDKRVAIFWSPSPELLRNGFHTQISICGTLEKHDTIEQYRVLIDFGSYSYFSPKDVISITHEEGHVFRDGAVAVIGLGVLNG